MTSHFLNKVIHEWCRTMKSSQKLIGTRKICLKGKESQRVSGP